MKLLAWDTSAKTGTIAAYEWDEASPIGKEGLRLISEWTLNVEALHSDRLLWSIHSLLQACRWKIQDVDLFAVGVGPGSFTGLRIGVTTARTLAHTLKKPLIGVSSLAALARPAAMWLSHRKERTLLIATTDAAKGELFCLVGSARSTLDCVALASGEDAGLWKRGVDEGVYSPEELLKLVRKKLKEGGAAAVQSVRWMAIGEGTKRYPELWRELPGAKRLENPALFSGQIQGRYLGLLAWEAYQAGIHREPLSVHPRYLRASDAELKLRAGLLSFKPSRGQ